MRLSLGIEQKAIALTAIQSRGESQVEVKRLKKEL
jgi:hypothetical protein